MGNHSSQSNNCIPYFENIFGGETQTANLLFIDEISSLTYEEFLLILGELNILSKKYLDERGRQLVFAVKKGTDTTFLWKATVQIACVRIDPDSQKVDCYRLLTLSEFLKVFKTLKCQLTAVQQSTSDSSKEISSSTFLTSLVDIKIDGSEKQSECCICLERKPEVLLPCAHSYCKACIEEWNEMNNTCPICREKLQSSEDTWILSDVPKAEEICNEIRSDLMNLAEDRTPPSLP